MRIEDAAVDFDRREWSDFQRDQKPEFRNSIFSGITSNAVLTGKDIYIQRNGLPAKKVGRVFASFLQANRDVLKETSR